MLRDSPTHANECGSSGEVFHSEWGDGCRSFAVDKGHRWEQSEMSPSWWFRAPLGPRSSQQPWRGERETHECGQTGNGEKKQGNWRRHMRKGLDRSLCFHNVPDASTPFRGHLTTPPCAEEWCDCGCLWCPVVFCVCAAVGIAGYQLSTSCHGLHW